MKILIDLRLMPFVYMGQRIFKKQLGYQHKGSCINEKFDSEYEEKDTKH